MISTQMIISLNEVFDFVWTTVTMCNQRDNISTDICHFTGMYSL